MLTNKIVLKVFSDYLARDDDFEVVLTSKGYTVMGFDCYRQDWNTVYFCPTPEDLLDSLLDAYENFRMMEITGGDRDLTEKDIAGMKAAAALRAADRNPYSWNMEFYEYPDGSGYEGRFTRCGICVLMKKLGLYDLTPALCRLDYTMSEAGGATDFVRQYTLASGGPYCDCGYKKKGFVKAGTEAGR